MKFIAKQFDELTANELYEILKSRAEIFVVEQNVVYNDMDNMDYKSLHCFIEDNGKILAYLRAFLKEENVVKAGRIMTVNHGNGLGRRLLENSIIEIGNIFNCKKICIDAQKHAVGFYEKFGFKTVSGEFLEDGTVRISMELELK